MELRSKVISSLRWVAMLKLAAQVVRWGLTFFIIRILEPDDYGIIALNELLYGLLLLLSTGGLGSAIIQATEISKRQLSELFGLLMIVNLGLFILQISLAQPVAAFYNEPRLVEVMQVTAVNFLLMLFHVVPIALLTRDLDFRTISIIEFSSAVAGAVFTLFLALADFGVWSLVYGHIMSVFLKSVLALIYRPVWIWPRFSFSESRHLAVYGGSLSVIGVLFFVFVNLDVAIAGRFWNTELLGYYAVALQLAVMPLNKIMPVLRQVAFPSYARIKHDETRVRRHYLLSMRQIAFVIFPIFWGMAAVGSVLIPVVLGDKWGPASLPFMALCLAMPFRALFEMTNPALTGTGRTRTVMTNTLLFVTGLAPAFLIAANFQLEGMALVWIAVFPALFVIAQYRYLKALRIPWLDYVRDVYRQIAASAAMLVAVYLTGEWMIAAGMSALTTLPAQILIGIASYTVLAWLTQRAMVEEFLGLLLNRSNADHADAETSS